MLRHTLPFAILIGISGITLLTSTPSIADVSSHANGINVHHAKDAELADPEVKVVIDVDDNKDVAIDEPLAKPPPPLLETDIEPLQQPARLKDHPPLDHKEGSHTSADDYIFEQDLAGDWTANRKDNIIYLLERTRDGLHFATAWTARKIDGRFGDEPFDEGKGVSGSLGFNTLWRQDRSLNTNLRLRARMDLPNLKESAYLFFGLDNEEELVQDQPESFTRQDQLLEENRRQDQTRFAGLGYGLRDNVDLRAGIRGGYKFYAQARYRKVWWVSDQDQIEFRETVFWTLDDRFGATTALNYDHAYSHSLALRWRNVVTLSETTNGFAWSSSVGSFKSFGDLRLLALEALIKGETGSKIDVAEYGLRTTWHQPLYEDWFLGRATIGYFWPQKEDDTRRGQAVAVGFGLELKF